MSKQSCVIIFLFYFVSNIYVCVYGLIIEIEIDNKFTRA